MSARLRETGLPVGQQTVNAKLLRDLIRSRVQLSAIEARVFRRDFLPTLRTMEKELQARLSSVNAKEMAQVTRDQMTRLLEDTQAIIRNASESMATKGKDAIRDVVGREARLQQATFRKALPAAVTVKLGGLAVEQLATIAQSVSTDILAPYSKTWSRKALDKAKNSLQDSVGFGEDMVKAGKRLAQAIGAARQDAYMMARTGIQAAAGATSNAYHAANREVLRGVQRVETLDADTCLICGNLDGTVWTFEADPEADGLYENKPPILIHPGCRGGFAPVVKSWRELGLNIDDVPTPGERASMNGAVPDSLDYEGWLKTQPENLQRSILGPERFSAWKRGDFALSDFTMDLRRRTQRELGLS